MRKAIIIGAGIAGITTAVELIKKNIKPIMLEQRKFVGGRAFSFRDEFTGDIIDNGQHLMMGAYSNFLKLLEDLGTKDKLLFTDGIKISFVDTNSQSYLFNTKILPGKLGLFFGMFNYNKLNLKSKIKSLNFIVKIGLTKKKYQNYDVSHLFSMFNLDNDSIKSFFEPLCLATMNAKPLNASAEIFINVIKKALFENSNHSKLIFPKSGLSELFIHFENSVITNGGELYFSEKVEKIEVQDHKITSVKTKSQTLSADFYIFTIPPQNLCEILGKSSIIAPENSFSKFTYSPIVSVYLWFDKDFIDSKITGVLNSNIQWIFNKRKIFDEPINQESFKGHYAITISSAEKIISLPKEAIIDICLGEINQMFPDSKKCKLLHSVVIKENKATVLLNSDSIIYRKISNFGISNLFIAGDWSDTGLPATIESACFSGKNIVEMISNSNIPP